MIDRELPTEFHPSRTKLVIFLIISLVFTAGGAAMILNDEPTGFFVAGFFGLCALIFVIQLLPGSAYLKVDADGLEYRTLYRTTRFRWEEVAEFGVVTVNSNSMIGINFSPEFDRARAGRVLSRTLSGFEGAIPDTYGQDPMELAEWLTMQRHYWLSED